MMVLAVSGWMGTARAVTWCSFTLKQQEFCHGGAHDRCATADYFPAIFPAKRLHRSSSVHTLGVGNAIIMKRCVGLFGAGHSAADGWGNMLPDAQRTMMTKPWLTIFPCMAI